ncbi:MAG: hypothetical protein C5B52_15480 [Bacteroidetes bacterium]|nr:MAG: hypothetical protein C5B52_15480 [Bacteroidota bacterium]
MPEHNNQNNDFISLNDVRNAVLDFFVFVYKSFAFLWKSLKKSAAIVFLFALLGTAGGVGYFILHPGNYQAQMILKSNDLTKRTYYEIINNLNSLLKSKSYARLAYTLKVQEHSIRDIIRLETTNIQDEPLEKDTSTLLGQPFKIIVYLRDNQVMDTLQNALFGYLNSNAYLKKKKQDKKAFYESQLEHIEMEEKRLDTIKENYSKSLISAKTATTFYNNATNPADLFEQSANLSKQKEKVVDWLNNESEPVTLIDGFKAAEKPEEMSLKFPVAIGLGIGLLTGLLIALLRSIKVQAFNR